MIKYIIALLFLVSPALAHDHAHPELDNWYTSLKRQDGFNCCSKNDCHPTEAEYRGEDVWARAGMLKEDGSWELADYIKVPKNRIIYRDNLAGEPVICHSMVYNTDHTLNYMGISIYCYIPGWDN